MIHELIDDLRAALQSFPKTDPRFVSIELVEQTLLRSKDFLISKPTTLFQCLWNWCSWHTDRSYVKHAMRDLSAVEAIGLALTKSRQLIVKQHESLDLESYPHDNFSAGSRLQMPSEILRKWLKAKRAEPTESIWLRLLRPPMATRNENSISILEGHRDSVERLVITEDDQQIISASSDESIRVWDYSTAREVLKIAHPGDRIADMALISNTRHIATASWAGDTFRVYRIDDGEMIGAVSLAPSVPLSVAVTPDAQTAAVGCDDGSIYVIDLHKLAVVTKLASDLKYSVMAVSFSCCGLFLVSGGRRDGIDVWNTSDWSLKGTVVPERISQTYNNRETEAIRCAPNDHMFASGHVDGSVRIWDLQSMTQVHGSQVLTHCLLSLAFSRDGRFILATGHSGESALCDAKTTRVIRQLRAHNDHVFSGAISSTGAWCATSSADNTIHVFHLDTQERLAENHAASISSFIDCGKSRVITAGLDSFIREWRTDTGELEKRYVAGNGIWSCAADSKGTRLFALRIDGRVEEVDWIEKRAVSEWIADRSCRQGAVAVSPDDALLAVVVTGRVFLHQLEQRRQQSEVNLIVGPYPCTEAIGLEDSEIVGGLHDLLMSRMPFDETIAALAALKNTVPVKHACCAQFSPCGAFLACGFTTGQVNLICLSTRQQVVLSGIGGGIEQLAVSHGGCTVSADTLKGMAKWDVSDPGNPQISERGDPAAALKSLDSGLDSHHDLRVSTRHLVLSNNHGVRTWVDNNSLFVKCVEPSRRWLVSDGVQISFVRLEDTRESEYLLQRLRGRQILGTRDRTTFTFVDEGTYILAFDGSLLGEENIFSFKDAISAALNFDDLKRLILDYTHVKFMSSASIGMLYGVRSAIQQRNGRMTLVGLNAYLKEVFLNNSLDEIFEIVDTVNDALENDSPPSLRRKSALEKAFLRLSGVEKVAVAAIRNGNESRGIAIAQEALSLPIQEYGHVSVQAGAAHLTVGRICFLAKSWQVGSDHFEDAYRVFSHFLGEEHPLTLECRAFYALCKQHGDLA